MKKLFSKMLSLSVILLLMILAAASCQPSSGGNEKEEENKAKEYNVAVGYPDGVIVNGQNPATVKHGGTVTFEVIIPEGYVFKSCDGATYDQETGILKVENVTSRMYLDFKIEKFEYDVTERFAFQFYAGSKLDTSTVPNGSVNSGTLITLTAGDTSRAFVGWTIGASSSNGAAIVSTEREYSIRISPDTVTGGALIVCSNYVDADTIP